MTKKKRTLFTISLVAVLLAAIVGYVVYSSLKTIVPEGAVGSTAGNLNNYGLFCESDGKVYFANSYDEGSLYVMNPDQTEIKKLYNIKAKYINAGGDYLFFHGESIGEASGLGTVVAKDGIYMIKKNGSDLDSITKDASQEMILVGNDLYYVSYSVKTNATFSKINVKKQKAELLLDFMVNPVSYCNGKIYYNGMYDDHHLYTYDIATNEVTDIWAGDLWYPACDGNYVYYMDVSDNYKLCRYSISDGSVQVLSEDRLDSFNYYNGIIFYQKSSETDPALIRINADGTNREVIKEGVFNSINVTSQYTYFKEFSDDYNTYCTSTYGTPNVLTFDNARAAITLVK